MARTKEQCFAENERDGYEKFWRNGYCSGKRCPNYPCETTLKFDALPKYPVKSDLRPAVFGWVEFYE